MIIDEAIERLETAKEGWPVSAGEKYYQALELGLEALKRVKGNRLYPQPTVYPLLPGETE